MGTLPAVPCSDGFADPNVHEPLAILESGEAAEAEREAKATKKGKDKRRRTASDPLEGRWFLFLGLRATRPVGKNPDGGCPICGSGSLLLIAYCLACYCSGLDHVIPLEPLASGQE
ncbi:MAG TPA: hypothetical protein VG457_05640, partial [Planctomycetota bacterium]|nr:hypothetical protein [Planctomycetota bacterium]